MMKTTIDADNALPLDAGLPLEMPSTDDLDPDFTIEAAGGPSDSGGKTEIPPPEL